MSGRHHRKAFRAVRVTQAVHNYIVGQDDRVTHYGRHHKCQDISHEQVIFDGICHRNVLNLSGVSGRTLHSTPSDGSPLIFNPSEIRVAVRSHI